MGTAPAIFLFGFALFLNAASAIAQPNTKGTALDPKYCAAISQEMDRIAPGHWIEFDGGERQAGEAVPVGWNSEQARARLPSYLVLAFDAPVRFRGEGFYTLTPEAAAPVRPEVRRRPDARDHPPAAIRHRLEGLVCLHTAQDRAIDRAYRAGHGDRLR